MVASYPIVLYSTSMAHEQNTTRKQHPWDKWLAVKSLTLSYGHDFYCTPYSMMMQLRREAKKRNLKIEVSVGIDGVSMERVDA